MSQSCRTIVLAVLCLALLSPAGADAYWFGRNKVQTLDVDRSVLVTPHFEITYAVGAEELAVRASIVAERTYREYADRLDHELEKRVPFILYSSHVEFAQTNIADDLLGEGTGGFTEPVRNRMVLPYEGSHADFVHVIRHEMVHVFMFDIAFGSSRATSPRSPFYRIPLWFAEGVAEWYASGWDAQADMYLRDASTSDYLWPLDRVGGFLVYKQGQAALRFLSERYGEEKIVEMWRMLGRTRSMDRVLETALGLEMKDLNREYLEWVRRRYWPGYGSHEEPWDIARRLTDFREEKHGVNLRPALSPDGDRLAFFSDRDGLMSLYLLSTIDGKVLHRLARGARGSRFESLHSFRSGVTFAPDGERLAFVARSGNAETLHVLRTRDGHQELSLKLGLDGASSPAWSPDGRGIVLVGTVAGRTDLYVVDLQADDPLAVAGAGAPTPLDRGAALRRLTDTIADEAAPAWSPDGRTLAYVNNPRAEVLYEFRTDAEGRRSLAWARFADAAGGSAPGHEQDSELCLLDVGAGTVRVVASGVAQPVWTGPDELCVVTEDLGPENLTVLELAPTLDAVTARRPVTRVAGAAVQPSYAPAADRLVFAAFRAGGYDLYAVDGWGDWSAREPGGTPTALPVLSPPDLVTRSAAPAPVEDPEQVGTVRDYKPRFSVDMSGALGGGDVYFSPQAGLGMANVIHLSDQLGDHRLSFLVNVYGSLEDSDLAASYAFLKRRIDYGFGVFHYKNYYNTAITSIGELLPNDTFFSERNYGFYGSATYPLNTFRRLSLEVQALASQRTQYVIDPSGLYLTAGPKRTDQLLQPSLSFVHDSAYYGYYGPVTGSRLILQYAPALPLGDALSRQTTVLDYRRYWLPMRRNTFAFRLLAAASTGDDARAFVLGGPFSLRGYDFYDYRTTSHLAGPKLVMANFEYRLPLLDALFFGWPAQWGFGPIGATLFFDVGAAWDDVFQPFGHDDAGRWGFQDLRGDYGIGIRTALGFLPLKFDWGRRTDLRGVGRTEFHFSIGPEF